MKDAVVGFPSSFHVVSGPRTFVFVFFLPVLPLFADESCIQKKERDNLCQHAPLSHASSDVDLNRHCLGSASSGQTGGTLAHGTLGLFVEGAF